MNKIGIMQGRLSPMINNKLQAFPVGSWESEFEKASRLGFNCIEMIFEEDNLDKNPLYSSEGILKIKNLINKTNVNVYSICAGYFIKNRLFGESIKTIQENIRILKVLINLCSSLHIKIIEIPCIEESEIKGKDEMNELVNSLKQLYPYLEREKNSIALEASLPPLKFYKLIKLINHPRIGITYDTGNSSYFGHSPSKEIKLLGKWISHVHIKDKTKHGESVPLGEGNVDFDEVFKQLSDINYKGLFILETPRGKNELKSALKNKEFLKPYFKKYGMVGKVQA